ncbi:MAG TPA: hypothetical protein VM934_09645 [Pyrinomonadaceae bacterium]|jgi:hypothetical protein|nr:hypothetical protein [Pyrinomonadaceae bacterium]
MKIHIKKFHYLLVFCTVALPAMGVIGVMARRSQQPPVKLPEIISKVKTLKVVSATIKGENGSSPTVVIEIRNNSDKPIIAVAIESGNDRDASGVTLNGFKSEDEPPLIVLKPYSTITMRLPLSSVMPGHPIKVGGVMYADGSEDGDEDTLETMRRQREHDTGMKPQKEGKSMQ